MIDLERNLNTVRQRIGDAATRSGRDPGEITLVAVSKTFPAETILAAYALGVRNFGENRVEEAADKVAEVKRRVQIPPVWHMVGHMQSRKVKEAVQLFDFVHSVDSVTLAQRLDTRAAAQGKTIPILLEVNVSGEASKYGFAPEPRDRLFSMVREILPLTRLDVQGLMTIAPIVQDADAARPYFRALRELRDALRARFPDRAWRHLSMGMTDDLEAAIAEGATIVRIGRAIFGERN